MKTDDEIEGLSYLWESDQWVLSASHVNQTTLRVVFEGDAPSVAELVALRKLADKYRDVPPQRLRDEVGQVKGLDLGTLSHLEANRVISRAKGLGLNVEATDASYTSYLPINRVTNTALLIDDDKLMERVARRMLDAGVAVISEAEQC